VAGVFISTFFSEFLVREELSARLATRALTTSLFCQAGNCAANYVY
jgi:hypothetical protein